MKNLIKLTLASSILLLGVGCSEDFLEKDPSEFLTQQQITDAASTNADVLAGTLSGIYSLQITPGTGGTTGADDLGQKGYDIFADMLSGDVALSQSSFGWYRADITEFQAPLDFTRTRNYMVWRYYYRIIRSANVVIEAAGGNDAVPENEENKFILGQAKALRAESYFYLAQYFQKSYNASEEILPLYDSPDDQNGPKLTASEIYDFIESDLTSAITFLDGFNRTAKNQINQDVARGILAYALAAKGDRWQDVMDLTSTVINSGSYPIMTRSEVVYTDDTDDDIDNGSGGGFNDVNTAGWMWGVDITSDIGIGLDSWWGQMDYYSYSYAGYGDYKAIDSGLYAQIPDGDVRKNQFLQNSASGSYLQPLFKFFDESRVPAGASQITTMDYVYMRVEEMYLLNAEASANLGLDDPAITSLKTLLDLRLDDTDYVDDLSNQALLDEIYLQTRIELWGEGKSYLALKRNKATLVRGDNHLSFVGVPIPFDDERLTFEIPESEILYNPFISTQNN